MKNRIEITIVHETAKAKLVEAADGRKAWMQNRWIREDNTVNAKTFEKNAQTLEAREEAKTAEKEFVNNYSVELTDEIIVRETEKAIAIKAEVDHYNIEKDTFETLWIPKSQIKENKIKGWLFNAKIQEIKEKYGRGGMHINLCEINVWV